MRIRLQISPNGSTVPFAWQEKFLGVLHKWLGVSYLHDELSLYSWSSLRGGCARDGGIEFPKGATMEISAWDTDIIDVVRGGINIDPLLFCGMKVESIEEIPYPYQFMPRVRFSALSPVFLKYWDGVALRHLRYDDGNAAGIMARIIRKKAEKAGLQEEFRLGFDKTYHHPKTKLVTIHGIGNKANVCRIEAFGSRKALEFIWNVGVGCCTGSGFGCVG